jgi:multidrug efflux pump
MNGLIQFALDRSRFTLSLLAFLLAMGAFAYLTIPKEAEPDIQIPTIYVSMFQRGISPEDSERLLLRPMEQQLKNIENLDEMRSTAYEGGGNVILEFNPGFDPDAALADVRANVDIARAELPQDAEEPSVQEVNISLFPVLVITLSGDVPERTLVTLAEDLEREVDGIAGVLDAEVQGARADEVQILIDPSKLEAYGIAVDQVAATVARDNQLIAAGALEGAEGRFSIKVPALIEDLSDLEDLPIVASQDATVRLADIATIRRTYADATSIARFDGNPAISLEVTKRVGANLIETVDGVRARVDEVTADWPDQVQVAYSQDNSEQIRTLLLELQNAIALAVILVFVILLVSIGVRASIVVGLAIPTSFLIGILFLSLFGLTVNLVVLFSLILAVGMLVDDTIIVAEFAERRMAEGMSPRDAYALASKRMAAPVVAATLTRIAAFLPLLFWPGLIGQFMMYMPITLIVTLGGSLVAALFFLPTLGVMLAGKKPRTPDAHIRPDNPYMKVVRNAMAHPWRYIFCTVFLMVAVIAVYTRFGRGVEFFPAVEPEVAQIYVAAEGNLSISEMDSMVEAAEQRIRQNPYVTNVYARIGNSGQGGDGAPADTVGVVSFEFTEWDERPKADVILEDLRAALSDLPGVRIVLQEQEQGVSSGKPIQIEFAGGEDDARRAIADEAVDLMRRHPQIIDIEDGRSPPGIDWNIDVDRALAARYGASAATVGFAVTLVTNGARLAEYRPSDAEDAVDIVLRFPPERRTLDQIMALRVATATGPTPISTFATLNPAPRIGQINRVEGERVITVTADVTSDANEIEVRDQVAAQLEAADMPPGVRFTLVGAQEDQSEASTFLVGAFSAAIFLIFAILLVVFNKFTSVMIVLSSIILATIGVFLGILIMGQTFNIVMTGVGIIALAGVVTNNNIVLIDTYDRLRREGMKVDEAILHTCEERARPVLLTAGAAMLGVLPIAFGFNVDFVNREILYGAPSTQWWIQLSTAIVYGLGFATILTLVVTPAMLKAIDNIQVRMEARKARRQARGQDSDHRAFQPAE